MQQSRSALSFFLKRGIFSKNCISFVLPGSGLPTAEQQCTYSLTSETVPLPRLTTAGSGPHPSNPPGSASSLDESGRERVLSKRAASTGSLLRVPRASPFYIRRKAASDLRKAQRAEDAAQNQSLKDQESAARISIKLKAAVEREKEMENKRAKVQKAKALEEKAKAEKLQQKILLGKRAPTAWALFVKDHIKALSHLPVNLKFASISTLYQELTLEQRQKYMDAALKLRTEQATHRAAIRGVKAARIPTNAYMLYKHDRFPEMKAADRSAKLVDMVKLISKQWWCLSESEKQLLRARVVKMNADRTQGDGTPVSHA